MAQLWIHRHATVRFGSPAPSCWGFPPRPPGPSRGRKREGTLQRRIKMMQRLFYKTSEIKMPDVANIRFTIFKPSRRDGRDQQNILIKGKLGQYKIQIGVCQGRTPPVRPQELLRRAPNGPSLKLLEGEAGTRRQPSQLFFFDGKLQKINDLMLGILREAAPSAASQGIEDMLSHPTPPSPPPTDAPLRGEGQVVASHESPTSRVAG